MCVLAAYVDPTDLVSQLLMERLLLFHQPTISKPKLTTDGPDILSGPADHTPSLSTPPTPSALAPRLTNQIAAEGAMAYLIDCYERTINESRSTLKVQTVCDIS